MGKKEKRVKKKGKKVRKGKKHISVKIDTIYSVQGGSVTRKKRSCPRCGMGTWLGEHKNRLYCGKCGYTIFEKS